MNRKRHQWPLLLLFGFFPAAAYADGISPILNFFHKDTWMPATVVTLIIILLESGILWWRIKGIRFTNALWKSLLLNAASSLTGSALLIAFSQDTFFVWDSLSFVVPLFLITLATEIPLLHLLFKTTPLSWKRSAILGCGLNVASYTVVFILEIGLFLGWWSYLQHLDRKEMAKENNPDLLKQASGLIYSTESVHGKDVLQVYDLQNACWNSLPNSPKLDPRTWDVAGNTCALVQWTNGNWENSNLIVCRLPDFVTLRTIPLSAFKDVQLDEWHGVADVAVSPDQMKLAVLFHQADTGNLKDRSSDFNLGNQYRLVVIDLASGQEMARATHGTSDRGLCWLSDSCRILFPSFDNEPLHQASKADLRDNTDYRFNYDRQNKRIHRLYSFDINTGKIDNFADGYEPSLATTTGEILLRDEQGLRLLDSSGKEQARVDIVSALGDHGAVVSPSGEMILAEIRRHASLSSSSSRLVLLHKAQPDVRHLMDDGFFHNRIDWTVAADNTPAQ